MTLVSRLIDLFCMAVYVRGESAFRRSPEEVARLAALRTPSRAQIAAEARSLELFDKFLAIWPISGREPLEPTKRVFWRLPAERQALALKWAGVYLDACATSARKPMRTINWLRNEGWSDFALKSSGSEGDQVA